MELNWSLKEVYESFESDEFKKDLEELSDVIKSINIWAVDVTKDKENLLEKLEEYINRFTLLRKLSSKLNIFTNLSLSVNTQNKNALKYSDILEKC